jgi:hypothetical protein
MKADLIYLLRKNYGEHNALQEEAANALEKLLAENTVLREELAAAQVDAKRYRWLKDNCALGIKQNGIGWSLNTRQCVAPDCMKEIDAAIDEAIRKEKTE